MNKIMSSISIHEIKNKQKSHNLFNILFSIILKIILVNLVNIDNCYSEIHLIIQGNGTQNILNNSFYIDPSEVTVN